MAQTQIDIGVIGGLGSCVPNSAGFERKIALLKAGKKIFLSWDDKPSIGCKHSLDKETVGIKFFFKSGNVFGF
jgi:hypothetical protein